MEEPIALQHIILDVVVEGQANEVVEEPLAEEQVDVDVEAPPADSGRFLSYSIC